MRWWYEFWIVFYNDMSEKDGCEHGILNATCLGDATEQLANYYGDTNIKRVDIRLVETYEDTPWLFDRDCDPNRARYWKADEQAKFFKE
jgi:hypothetical protein